MRRLLPVAAALLLLATTAACGSTGSDTPDTSSGAASSSAGTSTTTGAADLATTTAAACAEAVPVSEKAAAAFMADFNKALETAVSGNEADAEKALQGLRANLDAWATKLTELAGQPIEEPVKAALTDSAAAIKELAKPEDNTPVGQVEKTLEEATDKIKKACA